jgi:hypothetical protein
MFGFLQRMMSTTLLKGASGYMLRGERESEEVRGWVALALVGTPLGTRDSWPNPKATLDQSLREFENRFKHVRDVAFDIAHQHLQFGDQAKRAGRKATMYGFAVVANWLLAVNRRDTKQQDEHRHFIRAALQDDTRMLSEEWLHEFRERHGLPQPTNWRAGQSP